MTENPWIILIEILLAAGILIYLFFRKKSGRGGLDAPIRKVEVRLSEGRLQPKEIRVAIGSPFELIIYRYDKEPREELFEITDLDIYELLPALNATIIKMNPEKKGIYPVLIGEAEQAGVLIVE